MERFEQFRFSVPAVPSRRVFFPVPVRFRATLHTAHCGNLQHVRMSTILRCDLITQNVFVAVQCEALGLQ